MVKVNPKAIFAIIRSSTIGALVLMPIVLPQDSQSSQLTSAQRVETAEPTAIPAKRKKIKAIVFFHEPVLLLYAISVLLSILGLLNCL